MPESLGKIALLSSGIMVVSVAIAGLAYWLAG